MVNEKIQNAIDYFTRVYGNEDCFKVWVENINNEQKYIVKCSYHSNWFGQCKIFNCQLAIYD